MNSNSFIFTKTDNLYSSKNNCWFKKKKKNVYYLDGFYHLCLNTLQWKHVARCIIPTYKNKWLFPACLPEVCCDLYCLLKNQQTKKVVCYYITRKCLDIVSSHYMCTWCCVMSKFGQVVCHLCILWETSYLVRLYYVTLSFAWTSQSCITQCLQLFPNLNTFPNAEI